MTVSLSAADARRIALAAQGFADRRPAKPGLTHVRRLGARQHAIQIDSVNVLVRAHYVPAFSRLGPYPMAVLDGMAYRRRELFEYWAHAACLIPTALYPLFRWRMRRNRGDGWAPRGRQGDRGYVERVLHEVRDRGPLSASQLSDPGKRGGNWWGWADGKAVLEWLFGAGLLAIADRRNFERVYDLTERVIPREVLAQPAPPAEEAQRELLVLAARAMGVGIAKDLSTYFNLDMWWERGHTEAGRRAPTTIPARLAELVAQGRLVPARVEGWRDAAYLHPDAKAPRRIDARALISPFDPLTWERARPARVFGFDYRIEIYTPAPKRVYGYYVLPFLLGDTLVARVDLKADRASRRLLVPGAFVEPGHDPAHVARELAAELHEMATWLGLDAVEVGERGTLARELAKSL